MNRKILTAGFVAIAFFVAGCGDECDLQCPSNDPPEPQAIEVLVVTALAYPEMAGIIPGPLVDCGLLPAGSVVDTFSLLDYSGVLVIPSAEFLQRYDALLVFTDAWPTIDPSPDAFDTIGHLMADYVDTGGGLVMCQYMISGLGAGIRGRIISPGYAPIKEGTLVHVDQEVERSIVLDSIDFPLHPVFYGIDIEGVRLTGTRFALAFPELDETAILLSVDDQGASAVAISSSGRIIGINTYFKAFAFPDEYAESIKLTANSLLYVSGACEAARPISP